MAKQTQRKKQSLLNGALILVVSTVIVKLVSIFYKIPITNILGPVGRSYYNSAYAIFIPVYSIALAGLPTAISRMVSHHMALGEYRHVRQTLRVAKKIFLFTGTIGTILLIALAYPYATTAKNPEAFRSILVLAPSVFFCCVMSTYRGYYNGLRNMTPTAFSEVIEAVAKLVIGVIISEEVVAFGLSQFRNGGVVFGVACASESEAMSAIYPYAAAGAIGGVTLGTVLAFLYLAIRYRIRGDGITPSELAASPEPLHQKAMARQLIAIALPIVASTIIFNITNLIDSWTIQNRLRTITETDLDVLKTMYASAISAGGILDENIADYLYGAYEIASDFRNLLPSVTITFGISAIPVLSEAWTLQDHKLIKSSVESVIRIAMMISLPIGLLMGILSKPILTMFYCKDPSTMSAVDISALVMGIYCGTAFIFSITQPLTNMLQAIGRTDVPLLSLGVGAIFKVGLNYILIGIPELNIYGAIIGTLACYLVVMIIDLIFLVRSGKITINLNSVFLKPLFCSALCGLTAWSVYGISSAFLDGIPALADDTQYFSYVTVSLVIAVFADMIVYLVSMLCTRSLVREDVKMLPKGEKIAKILEKYGLLR